MKISFVIPTLNSGETIAACLQAITKQLQEGDEIILVDNGSSDETLAIAGRHGVHHIYSNPALSIGGLRNLGARKALSDVVAFIDSDCVIDEKWTVQAREIMQQCDISGCKYSIPDPAGWIEKIWFSQRIAGEREVNYINAGNFLIKRTVFEGTGGFDEQLETGEDSEYCTRLIQKGYRIVSNDRLSCVHLGNPKNILQFFQKQYWHSLGMLGSFKVDPFDKPLITTVFFLLLCMSGMLSILLFRHYITGIFFIVLIPFLATLYRYRQYESLPWNYFPHLLLLYIIYYLARALGLTRIFVNFRSLRL